MKQHVRLGLHIGQDATRCRASIAGKYQWLHLDAAGSCCIPTALARYTLAGEEQFHDLTGCGLYAYATLLHLPDATEDDLLSPDFAALIREIISSQRAEGQDTFIPIPCAENALPAPIGHALRTLGAQIANCPVDAVSLRPATFSSLYRYFKKSPLIWQDVCTGNQRAVSLLRSFLQRVWRQLIALNPNIELPVHLTVGCPCEDEWLCEASRAEFLALLASVTGCKDISLCPEPQAALLSAAAEHSLSLSSGVAVDMHGAAQNAWHMLATIPGDHNSTRLCHLHGADDSAAARLIENEMFFLVLQSAGLKSTALSPQEGDLLRCTLRRMRDLPANTPLSLPLYLKTGEVRRVSLTPDQLLESALHTQPQGKPAWIKRTAAYKRKYWQEIKNIDLTCSQAVCVGSVYALTPVQTAAQTAFEDAKTVCCTQADTRIADGLCRALTDPELKMLHNLLEKSTQNLPTLSEDALKSQLEAPLGTLLSTTLGAHLQQAILSFGDDEIRADKLQLALEESYEGDAEFRRAADQITQSYLKSLTESVVSPLPNLLRTRYDGRLVPLTADEMSLPLRMEFTPQQMLEDTIIQLDWETPGKKMGRRALILPAVIASLFTATIEPDDEDYSQEPLDAVAYKPIDEFHVFTAKEIAHMLKLCKSGLTLPKDFAFMFSVRCHRFAVNALRELTARLPGRLTLTHFDIDQHCL